MKLNQFQYIFLETGACYIAQTVLEFIMILRSQPPEGWDYRCVPPHLGKFLRKKKKEIVSSRIYTCLFLKQGR
jgi:hypothetical protein